MNFLKNQYKLYFAMKQGSSKFKMGVNSAKQNQLLIIYYMKVFPSIQ